METSSFESYPLKVVFLSIATSFLIYALGFVIISRIGILYAVIYLLYCLWVESKILRKSCTQCYYYGKVCGFGKGKVCSVFFRKADTQMSEGRKISWTDIIPDMLVLVIPLVVGIVMLFRDFGWLRVVFVALLVLLSFIGNAVIRGMFTCIYCRQRELGCPAAQFFGSRNKLG